MNDSHYTCTPLPLLQTCFQLHFPINALDLIVTSMERKSFWKGQKDCCEFSYYFFFKKKKHNKKNIRTMKELTAYVTIVFSFFEKINVTINNLVYKY